MAVLLSLSEVMDLEAFIKTMKRVLSNASDDMLEALFLKVDSDCNGFVTWVSRVPLLPQGTEEQVEGGPEVGAVPWGVCWLEGTLGVLEGSLLRLLGTGLLAVPHLPGVLESV